MGRRFSRARSSKARRFGRGRGKARSGHLPFTFESIDQETISNSYTSAGPTAVPGTGYQLFNDFRSLGELGAIYQVWNDAIVRFCHRLTSGPNGVRDYGPARTPAGSTYPNPNTAWLDLVSRCDPNNMRLVGREHIRYELVNVANTRAYCKIFQYIPKVSTCEVVFPDTTGGGGNVNTVVKDIVYKSFCLAVWPRSSANPLVAISGSKPNALWWSYPPPYPALSTTPFAPLAYADNMLTVLRLFGAFRQLSSWPVQPDLHQDLARNVFNTGGGTSTAQTGTAGTALALGQLPQDVYPETSTNGPPGTGGVSAAPYNQDINMVNFKQWDQGGSLGNFMFNPWQLFRAASVSGTTSGYTQNLIGGPPNVTSGDYTTVDYSRWPQYNEMRNADLRKVFNVRMKKVQLAPGQSIKFAVSGKKFVCDPVKHRLIYHENDPNPPSTVTDGNWVAPYGGFPLSNRWSQKPNLNQQQYFGPGYTGKTYYDDSYAEQLNESATPPNNLQLRGHGDFTTTKPMSICIRGQNAADSTTPHAMQIMPAVCVLQKVYTCRYNVKWVRNPFVRRHRTVVNYTTTPNSTLSNYKMQFPVVTGSAEVVANAGSYP